MSRIYSDSKTHAGKFQPTLDVATPATSSEFPANMDAERAILGGLLLDNEMLAEVGATLVPTDFSLDSHSQIFGAMLRIARAGSTVDIVILCAEMDKADQLKSVGGRAYLFSLTEDMPQRPNIDEYVRIVKEKSALRSMLTLFSAGMARVRDRGAQPAEILAWMSSGLARLGKNDTHGAALLWAGEDMDKFLAETETDASWLVQDVLAPGLLTQIFAPRGIGKSLLADHWAVELASSGKRVLILDRDNPRHTLRQRLRGFGADDLKLLKVISREKCPALTRPEEWWTFPYSDFDLVIVDSLDAMAEGVGEQDSAKPAKALAPLLDICHRENGPAVLMLGNTVKNAAHSRGSGVVEDRADIVFEARDATDFKPSGQKPWIEELPAQGASEWAARSRRREGRTRLRLALVATKFRAGEEPAPRMLEINMEDLPWTVADVTADIDAEGETQRQRVADEKLATASRGVAVLQEEIENRRATGQPEILKKEAETLLMTKARVTQKTARQIINSDSFVKLPVPGPGHSMKVVCATEIPKCKTPYENEGSAQPHFGCPISKHPTEIHPSELPMNTGDFETPFSVAEPPIKGVEKEHSEVLNGNGERVEWL